MISQNITYLLLQLFSKLVWVHLLKKYGRNKLQFNNYSDLVSLYLLELWYGVTTEILQFSTTCTTYKLI